MIVIFQTVELLQVYARLWNMMGTNRKSDSRDAYDKGDSSEQVNILHAKK